MKVILKIRTKRVNLNSIILILISIAVFFHYLSYNNIPSLIISILLFSFGFLTSTIFLIEINSEYLIIKKVILFNLIQLSKNKFEIAHISSIKYEVFHLRNSFVDYHKFHVFISKDKHTIMGLFKKKDLKKITETLLSLNPSIKIQN